MKSSYVVLASVAVALLIGSCSWFPPQEAPADPIPAEQRVLVVCEAWLAVFRRINARDIIGLATDNEIAAVDNALKVLNPVCTADPSADLSFDIVNLEQILIEVITSQEGN